MVGKYIKHSQLINKQFNCHYINLAIASSLEDIGKLGLKKIWRFVQLLFRILQEVKTLKPSLVYITPNAKGGAFYKEWVIVILLKSMGCQVVAHYHNKGVSTMQNKWHYNLMYRLFFKNIKVILLSELLYADIQKYIQRKDVYICPNGIPAADFEYIERNNSVLHLLFLSNLIESKGVLILLDALKILSDKGCSFICEFVGSETSDINRKRFENEVKKKNLNKLAVYHGKKYGAEKESIFEKADMFVFPSFYPNECFPLVLLEAMQYALPCISTNEGAIPDIIDDGKTGYIVNKKDADLLAAKIEELAVNKEKRITMGLNGYRKFKEQYTLQVFEKRLCDVLEQLI